MTLKLAKIEHLIEHFGQVTYSYVPYWTDGYLIGDKMLWLGWSRPEPQPYLEPTAAHWAQQYPYRKPTVTDWAHVVGLDRMDDDQVHSYRHVVQGTPHYIGQIGVDVFGTPGHGYQKESDLRNSWYLNYHEDSDVNNATNRLDLYFRTSDKAFLEAMRLGAARYQQAPTHRSPVFTCETCGVTRWLGSRGPIPTHCRACRTPSQKA